jgi:hypothetical protein
MILVRSKSEWFKQHLTENGGALTVTLRTMVFD